MIKEIKLNSNLDEKSLKNVIAGIGPATNDKPHGDCSCYTNCGTAKDNDVMHSNNKPI